MEHQPARQNGLAIALIVALVFLVGLVMVVGVGGFVLYSRLQLQRQKAIAEDARAKAAIQAERALAEKLEQERTLAERGVEVVLAEADGLPPDEGPLQERGHHVVVEVDREGKLTVDGDSVDVADLEARLLHVQSTKQQTFVIVKAPGDCPFKHVAMVMSLCQKAGVRNVATSLAELGAGEGGPEQQKHAWRSLFDGKSLTSWKIANFGGEGEVRVEDGAIVMEMGSNMTGVTYTGEVPKTNYEIELEAKRLEGIDFFCTTTFPVGDDPCTLVVGGWAGAIVGLSNVDERDASDNVTTRFMSFKDQQWYKVRIRVSDSKIVCWIDDKEVVNLPREGHKFGIRPEVELCKPLGISTWQTVGAVRKVRLRTLKPAKVEADASTPVEEASANQ